MIKLTNISKTYCNDSLKTEALREVNLSIAQGDYVSVMGPSGSGKSTLLHIIGAMDIPTEGEYRFNEMKVSSMKGKELHRFRANNIGFVFQNFALMKYYTVAENISMPLKCKGLSAKEINGKVEELLKQFGILAEKEKLVTHISGGQQARTAIARAIATDAPVILADEPTGSLDSRTGEEVLKLFDALNEAGKTIIIVTHDPKVAEHAKRRLVVEDGRVREG